MANPWKPVQDGVALAIQAREVLNVLNEPVLKEFLNDTERSKLSALLTTLSSVHSAIIPGHDGNEDIIVKRLNVNELIEHTHALAEIVLTMTEGLGTPEKDKLSPQLFALERF